MTTLELGPVIGKISGGAEVQKTAVSATVSKERAYDLHTVDTAGETWLVVVSGTMNNSTLTGERNSPYFRIGSHEGARLRYTDGEMGMAAEVSGTATVSLVSQRGYGGFDFSGHVWAVPLA